MLNVRRALFTNRIERCLKLCEGLLHTDVPVVLQ
jgi:hypothetical protein